MFDHLSKRFDVKALFQCICLVRPSYGCHVGVVCLSTRNRALQLCRPEATANQNPTIRRSCARTIRFHRRRTQAKR
jgi:hypothetical protein